MTIHEMRARAARDFTATASGLRPMTCTVDMPRCRVVERNPATTPDPRDEAYWAAQRPLRRIEER